MVGRRALNAKIGVRIPASEQRRVYSSVVERCPDKTDPRSKNLGA